MRASGQLNTYTKTCRLSDHRLGHCYNYLTVQKPRKLQCLTATLTELFGNNTVGNNSCLSITTGSFHSDLCKAYSSKPPFSFILITLSFNRPTEAAQTDLWGEHRGQVHNEQLPQCCYLTLAWGSPWDAGLQGRTDPLLEIGTINSEVTFTRMPASYSGKTLTDDCEDTHAAFVPICMHVSTHLCHIIRRQIFFQGHVVPTNPAL